MKNNTKVRLHLSKQLFESLAKQVLAEAKKGDMSGGAYTEAVKAPKGEKKEKAPKADKEVKTEKIGDSPSGFSSRDFAEKGSPKSMPNSFSGDSPKTTKGASKQQVSADLMKTSRELMKRIEANVQAAEGGVFLTILHKLIDILDDKDNSSTMLTRVDRLLDQLKKTKPVKEMETMTAEGDKVNEALTAETGLIEVGEWAAKLLGKTITDDQALMTLGSDVLTAATGIAFAGGLGLAMYADDIKAGIKKAAAALKNLAKSGSTIKEGDGENPLAHLDSKTIAALKK